MMARFRQDYLDLLEGRVVRIEELVARHELEPAQVALLSLEASSVMVGAGELVAAVRALRSALDTAPPQELGALTSELVAEAARAADGLTEHTE